MSHQTQRAKDPDFLEGIDEQFQRQMKTSASASHNGRSSGRVADDPLLNEIVTEAQVLSVRQKETVLSYIRALKQKNE